MAKAIKFRSAARFPIECIREDGSIFWVERQYFEEINRITPLNGDTKDV